MTNTTYGSPYVQSSDLVSGWPATSLAVADRIDDVSFKGNGLNNQTASYTGVLTDAGKTIMMNVGSANDFTIPASGTVAYELGTMLRVSNKGAGVTTIKPNGGVVLNGGNIALGQYQSATVQLVAADIWSPVATPAPSASGLTLINTTSFSDVSSVSLNNVFTSTYANYKIVISESQSAVVALFLRLRAASTDITEANYWYSGTVGVSNGVTVSNSGAAQTKWDLYGGAVGGGSHVIDLVSPNLTEPTKITWQTALSDSTNIVNTNGGGLYTITTPADGFTIYPTSGTTTGTVRVYGYQNS